MIKIIEGKRYNTETAELLATSRRSESGDRYNCGTRAELYRTKKGGYFVAHYTLWQGSRDQIAVVDRETAINRWVDMDQEMEFVDAFHLEPVEA